MKNNIENAFVAEEMFDLDSMFSFGGGGGGFCRFVYHRSPRAMGL